MAKLEDLLAQHLFEWPHDANRIIQIENGDLVAGAAFGYTRRLSNLELEIAEDRKNAVVTRRKYLAARDRMHAESAKGKEVSGVLEAQEVDPEKALWDKVAAALAPAVYSECCKTMDEEGYPENWREGVAKDWILTVDAFMAERAKRLKGGA